MVVGMQTLRQKLDNRQEARAESIAGPGGVRKLGRSSFGGLPSVDRWSFFSPLLVGALMAADLGCACIAEAQDSRQFDEAKPIQIGIAMSVVSTAAR